MTNISEQYGQGADWTAIGPLIQARQQHMSERNKLKTDGIQQAKPVQATQRLSDQDRETVEKLRARDREVREHEQAHARVGGAYAGQPSYAFQTGPDGKQYAIGGEVQIDVTPVADDPQATIAKMMIVKAAALAPAKPSSADRKVAALADSQKGQALADLAALKAAERRGDIDIRA